MMKAKLKMMTLAVVMLGVISSGLTFAQESDAQKATRARVVGDKVVGKDSKTNGDGAQSAPKPSATDDKSAAGAPQKTDAAQSAQPASSDAKSQTAASEDEAAIDPYYNSFFSTYRLGPEDVISVTVFDQPRYSRSGVTIPPNGKISMPLIPEGILVAGKTTEEIARIITKKYDEYIIEPKVDVQIDKAASYRYSVVGDVPQPGIKPMARRMTAREAIAEAGGVLNTGDKSKIFVIRRKPDTNLAFTPINLAAIERGRAKDDFYLEPGDQVVVPGNKFKKIQQVLTLLPVLSFARIFAGGF